MGSSCIPGLGARVTVVVTFRLCWVNVVLRAPYGSLVQISTADWTTSYRTLTLRSSRNSRSSSRYKNT